MIYWRKILPILLALLGLVSLTLSGAFAQGSSLQVQSPLEKMIAGFGGEEALDNLDSLAIETGGTRWVHDEGFVPGVQAGMIGPFEAQITYDIAGDGLRLDYVTQSLGNERQVSEVISGELGYLDGMAANFGTPGVSNMSSDRWASIRKHQRLLNPHVILQSILANPGSVTEGGEVLLDGSVHHTLVVEDVAPMTLYVNAGTGRLAKLTTVGNDGLRRDVPLEIFYYSWQPVGDLFFPAELYVAYDGDIVHKEIRSTIEVNPEIDGDLFEFPAEASPVFDEELAARGESHHQYLQTFAAFGFPRDGIQPQVNAQEIASGVYFVAGGSHNSLAIEQDDGIVIVEAPLDEVRSEAVINWVETTFPGKAVSHVVSSHHHVDHSAGLRTYVAQGATAVMHETAAPFFAEIFLANSTIVPDPLAENPVAATIETVEGDGPFTISDTTNSVEVYRIENTHAEDMVITFVPEAGVVFVSDLYSPNPAASSAGPGGLVLNEAITGFGLDVSTIAGGHGGTIAYDDFEAILGQ